VISTHKPGFFTVARVLIRQQQPFFPFFGSFFSRLKEPKSGSNNRFSLSLEGFFHGCESFKQAATTIFPFFFNVK
jgi:hypothetical protein